ncbi:DNA-processing protein DprA [Paenibacillus harenae]|uniref:DNA processing protein n=1 Tax=Paenibacillus harenae TaxID=306543 RepID=A0ABT9U233_PAEHA|nr:DNA-processing protein DprA [Paenibacillus harenae]MDQ0113063.1 DNA processing protein [Paenibacillus harenae]
MKLNNELRRSMVVAFYEIPGIGWHSIKKAIEHQLWLKPIWTLELLIGIGLKKDQAQAVMNRFAAGRWDLADKSAPAAARAGAVTLTPFDKEYPYNLRQIDQPPWVLYAKGNLDLLHAPSVAIVGTRVPTAYGRHSAREMSKELSDLGLTVVSGLAKGIDSLAHEAALDGVGGTIAVLPTPIDTCYPSENRSLFRAIAEKGLLVSETPIGTTLHPGQFPQRNRIIAGLSVGTVVVEGAKRSGSLITAKYALDMSRELFAIPGQISSPKSEGPNDLIKKGSAKLISCATDIIEELRWLPAAIEKRLRSKTDTGTAIDNSALGLTAEERQIVGFLQDQPLSINELHELSAIPFGHLNALLINLCIKRKIELQPGSIYIAL